MNKLFLALSITFFTAQVSFSQNINLELVNPHPTIQAADVGDLEFADIDGDGDADLIVIGKGGPILTTIYLNDGFGNFTEDTSNSLSNVFNGTIRANDIDGDGDLDLVITGQSGSFPETSVYLNNGSGLFSTTTNSGLPNVSSGEIEFADVDNDGDDDVLMSGLENTNNDPLTKLFLNNGSGVFSESTSNVFEPLSSEIEFFDCDGDNDLDLLISGSNYNTIDRKTIFYKNDGTGVFTEVMNTAFNHISAGGLAIGDSDNDGDLDVLISGNISNSDIETELYLNDGMGNFTMLTNTVFSDVSNGEVSFDDFDNDGDVDVFVMGTGEGGLANNSIVANIYENLGGNMYVISDSLIGGYLASHAVADIDGDNDLDLILAGTTISTPTRATWLYTNETNITASLNNFSSDSYEIALFPNPANDKVTISLNSNNASDASVTLTDALGSVVLSELIIEFDNKTISINSSVLPTGIYFVNVQIGNEVITRKLSILH